MKFRSFHFRTINFYSMKWKRREIRLPEAPRQEMAMIVERIGIIINNGEMWSNPIGLRHLKY